VLADCLALAPSLSRAPTLVLALVLAHLVAPLAQAAQHYRRGMAALDGGVKIVGWVGDDSFAASERCVHSCCVCVTDGHGQRGSRVHFVKSGSGWMRSFISRVAWWPISCMVSTDEELSWAAPSHTHGKYGKDRSSS